MSAQAAKWLALSQIHAELDQIEAIVEDHRDREERVPARVTRRRRALLAELAKRSAAGPTLNQVLRALGYRHERVGEVTHRYLRADGVEAFRGTVDECWRWLGVRGAA